MYQLGELTYPDRRSVRSKLSQQGVFSSQFLTSRLNASRLKLHERMYRQDITLKSALRYLTDAVVSSIGEVSHPDPEIAKFVNTNLRALEDIHGISFYEYLRIHFETMLWAGFSVSEVMYDLKFGSLYLKQLLTYHPSTIIIRADKSGMLTEGKATNTDLYKSGIYQTQRFYNAYTSSERHLKFWKIIYTANESEYGNYYGESLLGPSYKWWRLKEELIGMMIDFLDKASRGRKVYLATQSYNTEEKYLDPSTGQERYLTTLDLLKQQIESNPDTDTVLMSLASPEHKIFVESVPLVDNFGNQFTDSISYADQESVRHIIPYFLITDVSRNNMNEVARERRMEVFYQSVKYRRELLVRPLLQKIIQPLITWNFNRDSAKIPATFTYVYNNRPEDRVETMQFIKGMAELGSINLRNEQDWSAARQMIDFPDRELDKNDIGNIKEIFVNPRQKEPRSSDVGNQGSGAPGRPVGNTTPQISARDAKL